MRLLSKCFFLLVSHFFIVQLWAQKQPSDTLNNKSTGTIITIESADRYNFRQLDSTQLVSLGGNAFVQQGKTKFYADSIVLNQQLNMLEAFGKIHINDADSIHTYASYLKYLGKEKKAYLNKDVKLTDGKGILTTQELTYDVATKIGTYTNGGKVVNGKTVLTSTEGYYYGETKDVYFKKKVVMISPDTKVLTDTLLYNTTSQIATFVVPTTIYNGKRTIKTKDGFYDIKQQKAQLGKRSVIDDSTYTFVSDDAIIDDKSGLSQYHGNAVYRSKDSLNGYDLIANDIKINKKTNSFLATEKPILLIKNNRDTTFIAADTLFSSKLIELTKTRSVPTLPYDSLTQQNKNAVKKQGKDSANDRFFEAYYHVKIFSDSLQATCDSMFYSLADSTFRLFKQPIVWSQDNQITGDTMYLYLANKKPLRLFVFENAMAIQKIDEPYFNQVKSTILNAYFKDGQMHFIRAKGSAESVYYGVDEKKQYAAVNKSTCDIIDIYFEKTKNDNSKAQKIVLRSNVVGTAYPMRRVNHQELRLRKFQWHEAVRPKSKFEILSN